MHYITYCSIYNIFQRSILRKHCCCRRIIQQRKHFQHSDHTIPKECVTSHWVLIISFQTFSEASSILIYSDHHRDTVINLIKATFSVLINIIIDSVLLCITFFIIRSVLLHFRMSQLNCWNVQVWYNCTEEDQVIPKMRELCVGFLQKT